MLPGDEFLGDPALRASARSVAWLNHEPETPPSPDDLAAAIVGDDPGHRILLPGLDPIGWALLAPLVESGSARLVLPRPGDLRGRAGDVAPALEGVGCIVAIRLRGSPGVPSAWHWLAPERGPDETLTWVARAGEPPMTGPSYGEADRALRRALLEALEAIDDLPALITGTSSRTALDDGIEATIRAWTRVTWPPGWPVRHGDLCLRSLRILLATAAVADAGVDLTAGHATRRRIALAELAATARRALESAVSDPD